MFLKIIETNLDIRNFCLTN